MLESKTKTISLTILVASLGYFVDVYDLQLFNIVSRESIAGIGITDEALIASMTIYCSCGKWVECSSVVCFGVS